jgi:hypothetical protein
MEWKLRVLLPSLLPGQWLMQHPIFAKNKDPMKYLFNKKIMFIAFMLLHVLFCIDVYSYILLCE